MTDAILHSIEGRSRADDIEPAKLEHFTLSAGQAVSSQLVVDEPYWTPYCIDHEKRQMIFVDLPLEVDLAEAVFVHLMQFHHARRILLVPYEALEGLAEQCVPAQKLILIFNLPRSGTTLASRLFNQIEGVWSLSEPDIFTDFNELKRNNASANDIQYLLKHGIRLMFRPLGNPRPRIFALKPRSQAVFIAEHYYSLFPDAKYIYLYRDGLSFAESFYRFGQRLFGMKPVFEREFTIGGWKTLLVQENTEFLENLLGHDLKAVTVEEFFAAFYCKQCEQYVDTFEQGVPYDALRYNELNSNRESEITRLLQHCELPTEVLPQAMKAFEEDAQAGTQIARDIPAKSFTEAQRESFLKVLARHPRFNDSDLLLPDIYHPERGK